MNKVKLVPIVLGSRNLDAQMLSLPPLLEISVLDDRGNKVFCDCDGFYLNHGILFILYLFIYLFNVYQEDFSGDIYAYKPLFDDVPYVNIITFGPWGAGKARNSIPLTLINVNLFTQ